MDGDRIAEVTAARHRLATDGPAWSRDIDGDFEVVALPRIDGDLVRDLLIDEAAGTVVEIGLAYGSSALAIGEALLTTAGCRARHLIIDPYQTSAFSDVGWQALTEAGLEATTTLVRDRSQLALPRLVAEGFVADAAFVDGSHHFHNVFVDLYYLGELVRPGGLIILDDYPWPSVAAAVGYFERNCAWRPLDVPRPASGRIRAVRLPDPPVETSFEDFEPFR